MYLLSSIINRFAIGNRAFSSASIKDFPNLRAARIILRGADFACVLIRRIKFLNTKACVLSLVSWNFASSVPSNLILLNISVTIDRQTR